MNFKIICLGILFIAMSSCSSSRYDNQFYWLQTQCADPWGTTRNDSNAETSAALEDFLGKEDIKVLRIEYVGDLIGLRCEACSCKTGFRIYVSIHERDNGKIEKLGFTQVE